MDLTTKETILDYFIILMFLSLATCIGYIWGNYSADVQTIELTNADINASEVDPLFLAIAKQFRLNHEYTKWHYNCVNFSKDLDAIYDELGFDSRLVRANVRGEEAGHMWVRVYSHGYYFDIETTNGELMTAQSRKKYVLANEIPDDYTNPNWCYGDDCE
jgi:hypothetical protein